jgi:hypothetical protein
MGAIVANWQRLTATAGTSPELPFTTSRAANGSGSDELDDPFSPDPPAPGTPQNRPAITIDLDNFPMNTRLRYRPHPTPPAPGRMREGWYGQMRGTLVASAHDMPARNHSCQAPGEPRRLRTGGGNPPAIVPAPRDRLPGILSRGSPNPRGRSRRAPLPNLADSPLPGQSPPTGWGHRGKPAFTCGRRRKRPNWFKWLDFSHPPPVQPVSMHQPMGACHPHRKSSK